MNSRTSPTTKPLFRINQAVWYLLALLETLLIFRFFLKLFGANIGAGFTSFIYNASQPFITPFLAVFSVTSVEGSIFEWTTLLATFVYWLIATGIVQLLIMSRSVSTPEAAEKLRKQEGV